MKRRVLPLLLIALVGCTRQTQEAAPRTQEKPKYATPPVDAAYPKEPVAPNVCRVIAKVVSIDSTLDKQGESPCGKAPCTATLRIASVLGVGSSFGSTPAVNSELKVRFLYTTGATGKLFPNMKPDLPGLSVGSVIKTDLIGGGDAPSGSATVVVERYEIQ
ncbi:MAG: hypothetical protein HY966_02710 [Ignavibacteriales bacterium]|nr:hypothetical protein [Ignavibacteriales bacterium]